SSSGAGSSESSQSDDSESSSSEGSSESWQSDDSGSSSSEGSSESSQSDESGSSSGEGSSESSQSDKSGSSSGEDERVGVMNKSGKTQKQGGSGVRGVVAGGGSKKSGESDDSGNSSGEVGKVGGMNKSGKTQKQGGSGSVRSGVLVVVASGGFKKSGESVISGSSSGGVDTVDGGKGSKGDKVGGGKGKTVSIKATAAGIRGGSYVVQAVPLRAPFDVTTVRDVVSQHSSSDRRNVVRVAVANGQRNKKENNIVTEKLRTRIGQSGGKIITKILGICKAIVLGQTYRVTGEESNRIRDLTINSISMYDRTRNVDSRYSRLLHNLRRGRQFEQPSISKKSYTQNCAPQDIYVSYVYEYDMHNQVFNSSFQDPNSILIKGLQSDIARYTAEELYKRNLVPYVTDEAHLTKIMDVSKQYNDQAALRFYISIDCVPSKQHEYYILTLIINGKRQKFNVTCTAQSNLIEPNYSNKYPLSKASLFGIIVLAACITFTLFLCVGWFSFTYYRQYKRRQIKIKLQEALANSVQQILDKTPIVTFIPINNTTDSNSEDPMCAICLESFIDNEKVRKLMCSHYFHTGCIDPWLLSNQNCPLCNRNILSDYVPSISDTIKSNRRETLNQQSRSTNTVNNRQSNPILENQVLNSQI
ncbi:unnamed protein product, partial [Rotaria magnacalcarata]